MHQVEYAIEAINGAGTCVGLMGAHAVIFAGERKSTSKLLAPTKTSEKTYKIDDHISCMVAGLTADANILINEARLLAQRYTYKYHEPIPVEQLVQHVCNYKHSYTQYGGLRPFGVGFLFAGWDRHHGFQIYQTDPSGNYSGWKATVIGQNNQAGKSVLKSDYKEGMEMGEALEMAARVLVKTMDMPSPSPDKVEFAVLVRDPTTGVLTQTILGETEVQVLLARVAAKEEAESKAASAGAGGAGAGAARSEA